MNKNNLKITYVKFHSNLPGANELMVPWTSFYVAKTQNWQIWFLCKEGE